MFSLDTSTHNRSYTSFAFTWFIFVFFIEDSGRDYWQTGLFFNALYFAIFYFMIIASKIQSDTKFTRGNTLFVLLNAFVFFGLGYVLLEGADISDKWADYFPFVNALIHFGVAGLVYFFNRAINFS